MGTAFSDRPEADSWQSAVNLSSGIDVSVTVGSVPEVVNDTLRSWRVHRNYLLDSLFGNSTQGMPLEDRRQLLLSREESQTVNDFDGYETFATFEASRAVRVTGDPTARFLWVDEGPTTDQFDTFEEKANAIFDGMVPWMMPVLDHDFSLSSTLLPGARAFLIAPGKAAVAIPRMDVSAQGTVRRKGWASFSFAGIEARLSAYESTEAQIDRYLSRAGRWLSLALAESDGLRRFIFAYGGLEVLVQKVQARVRALLTSSLEQELPKWPVGELIWPRMSDDTSPDRNLVFKFASLISVVSPDTAIADTEQFRTIATARNNLAHGSEHNVEDLPVQATVELLRRCVSAIATAVHEKRLT